MLEERIKAKIADYEKKRDYAHSMMVNSKKKKDMYFWSEEVWLFRYKIYELRSLLNIDIQ